MTSTQCSADEYSNNGVEYHSVNFWLRCATDTSGCMLPGGIAIVVCAATVVLIVTRLTQFYGHRLSLKNIFGSFLEYLYDSYYPILSGLKQGSGGLHSPPHSVSIIIYAAQFY